MVKLVTRIRMNVHRLLEHIEDKWRWYHAGTKPDLVKYSTMYRFNAVDDIARFEVHTDRVMGGRSDCGFSIQERDGFRRGVFEGIIDCVEDEDPRGFKSAGFASFRTYALERIKDFETFTALVMRVKTDGRPYTVFLRTQDVWSEEIFTYQCELAVPGGEWTYVAAPFDSFMRVTKGYLVYHQTTRDMGVQRWSGPDPQFIKDFGITLQDGLQGPFRLEIEYVGAIRDYDENDYYIALPPGGRNVRKRIKYGSVSPQILTK